MERLILAMLSEDPRRRPRFSEIIRQLEKLPMEKPEEREFVEIFKAELNSKKGIEFQLNLFDFFESFPIFYFNGDRNEAERIMNEIEKLVEPNLDKKRIEFKKMKILKGDLLMSQKKYDLAENEYLSCDFTIEEINELKHKDLRLTLLYKLMVIELKDKEKLIEYNLKLEEMVSNLEKEHKNYEDERYNKSSELKGFQYMIYQILGTYSVFETKKDFETYKKQILRQSKNKEILRKNEEFFNFLEKNQFLKKEELLLFTEIAGYLVLDFEMLIASFEEGMKALRVKHKNKNEHSD